MMEGKSGLVTKTSLLVFLAYKIPTEIEIRLTVYRCPIRNGSFIGNRNVIRERSWEINEYVSSSLGSPTKYDGILQHS